MSRLQVGVVRYASAADAVKRELGFEIAPEVHIGRGRVYVTFRNLGASRWPLESQAEHAFQVAAVTRSVFARDDRWRVRSRSRRAIVVVYEDTSLVRGCETTSRWECIIPAPQ